MAVWEGGGGSRLAARFQDAAGTVVILPVGVDPTGYPLVERNISLARSISKALVNGTSGKVTISATPISGNGILEIIEELPRGLVPSDPSHGGVVEGNSVRWAVPVEEEPFEISYSLMADMSARETWISALATFDDVPVSIAGDRVYLGAPVNRFGFIKLFNHLGPLAGVDCTVGEDLAGDWIVDEAGTVTEQNIRPFPGLITRPSFGGDGITAGSGARAQGVILEDGGITEDAFLTWRGTLSPSASIEMASPSVNGFFAERAVNLASVYVTNTTGEDLPAVLGAGAQGALEVHLDGELLDLRGGCGFVVGLGETGAADVTLSPGEHHLLVKYSSGATIFKTSPFHVRFRAPSGDGIADGFGDPRIGSAFPGHRPILPPTLTYSLVSNVTPPPRFLRGDCNDDGGVDISDVTCTLNRLFAGGPETGCIAALNTNGDGTVGISDPVWLLNHLFAGGPAPVAPFPDCGPGMLPADATLGCANPPNCQ